RGCWFGHRGGTGTRREREVSLPDDKVGAVDISIPIRVTLSKCRATFLREVGLPGDEIRTVHVAIAVEIAGMRRGEGAEELELGVLDGIRRVLRIGHVRV